MGSLITRIILELISILPETVYVLLDISPRYAYENNARTDKIIGYVYTAVNTESFDTIKVFVEQAKPLMPSDELRTMREQSQQVLVEFENAVVKPYYSDRTKSIEDSIKADAVHMVKK